MFSIHRRTELDYLQTSEAMYLRDNKLIASFKVVCDFMTSIDFALNKDDISKIYAHLGIDYDCLIIQNDPDNVDFSFAGQFSTKVKQLQVTFEPKYLDEVRLNIVVKPVRDNHPEYEYTIYVKKDKLLTRLRMLLNNKPNNKLINITQI